MATRYQPFSSGPILQKLQREAESEEAPKSPKRKHLRSPAGKNSLRRVAVEAQRSRDVKETRSTPSEASQSTTKTVTAYCAAEQYDIGHVAKILKGAGYHLDPYETGLYPQVVHTEILNNTPSQRTEGARPSTGDVFIFPSGTVVAWDVPESTMSFLVGRSLSPAAQHPHPDQIEEEDLEYTEDPNRDVSAIRGDTIVIGTKTQPSDLSSSTKPSADADTRNIDTVLAKIAFSSGLARSTKLAVLETLLSSYLNSTSSIPRLLSLGGRLPFTRLFILQKTGQLLSLRAQLNLYSELTDSLPDLFWDSPHEKGLEGYYDMVGRALDTNVRIKVLNEKMDYAQEIASVLRQQLSERHGVRLEWIIILLITVEVGFAIRQEVKEWRERQEPAGA
ncbi:MAG: hypothetical protein LQ344_006273 [Seirophora lacunosa]|nr:MAG: hypothetical protein LQ344_006273 [Seirophora lacunosa]